MRTPDSAAGKKGKCPHCGAVMQIPARSAGPRDDTRGPAPKSVASAKKPAPVVRSEGDRIEFPCPQCTAPVRTPASAAGKKGKCPSCGAVVPIPKPTVRPASGDEKKTGTGQTSRRPSAATKGGSTIDFHCPECKKRIRTPLSAAGKKGRCPKCGAIMRIPAARAARSSAQAKETPGLTPQAGSTPGLTPLPEQTPGLTPLSDDAPGLVPLDDDTPGLTLLSDQSAGLTPLPHSGGLTPLDESGLTPLGNDIGLTPLEDDPLGGPAASDPFASASATVNPFSDSYRPAAGSLAGGGVNPYQSPSLSSPGYARRAKPVSKGVVMAPAIAMMVVVSLNLLVMIPYMIFYSIFSIKEERMLNPGGAEEIVPFAIGTVMGMLLVVAAYVVMLVGAWRMMRFESWGLALTSAILLLLPCTVCWMGLPFGIWALVVLSLSNVRAAFK
jgi:hypothetical protein